MAETEKTPEEIAREIVRQYHGARVTPYNLVGAIAAALHADRERADKAEAEAKAVREAHLQAIRRAEQWADDWEAERARIDTADRAGWDRAIKAAADVVLTKCHDDMTRDEEAAAILALDYQPEEPKP